MAFHDLVNSSMKTWGIKHTKMANKNKKKVSIYQDMIRGRAGLANPLINTFFPRFLFASLEVTNAVRSGTKMGQSLK
jgi:hypothetical protein